MMLCDASISTRERPDVYLMLSVDLWHFFLYFICLETSNVNATMSKAELISKIDRSLVIKKSELDILRRGRGDEVRKWER